MNGTPFKLATFAAPGGAEFAAIVLGADAIGIAARARRVSRHRSRAQAHAQRHEIAARPGRGMGCEFRGAARARAVHREGELEERAVCRRGRTRCGASSARAGRSAGKNPQCRAEFPGTRQRDDPRRHVAGGPAVHRRENIVAPLHVPESAERARRRLRRHRDPARHRRRSTGRPSCASRSAARPSASRRRARSTASPAS